MKTGIALVVPSRHFRAANLLSCASVWEVATIVAYLKEVESPYAVLDFIRSYLGDTVEAKEFAKQFLERRAKQKANQQRQQQQVGLSLSMKRSARQVFISRFNLSDVGFC